MMLKLRPDGPVIANLEPANTLWARTRGLLGRTELPPGLGLWIKPCNSVHTFFMKFTLDLVFLDEHLVVRKTYRHVRPWRLVLPVLRARSVVEFRAGFLDRNPLQPGDRVYVDHTLS